MSKIPPVDETLRQAVLEPFLSKFSHKLVLATVQEETTRLRQRLVKNKSSGNGKRSDFLEEIASKSVKNIVKKIEPSLKRVVNATGIILHTGLGRAPLPEAAKENLIKVAEGYCNLEFDLESGKRGSRTSHVEELLCFLTGAEAACVVNNNAAAVLLALNTLSFGKEAIVSRGQLIEIGGSFRIPEVMEKSGARMVEVGTTNKTHFQDYEKAITKSSGLICVVHPSNFRVKGFTSEVALADLVKLSRKHKIPILQDLGGGVLFDLQDYNLPYEPVVRESVERGVDVVTFSGDKVLGGPQSGIIVGKKGAVEAIKQNPLMRALRCDKLIYAALEPTLKLYLKEKRAFKRNRVLQMMLEPIESLQGRAKKLEKKLRKISDGNCQIEVKESFAQIGSGALPLAEIPSIAVCLRSESMPVNSLAQKFRNNDPAIIGYVRNDTLFFDLRTVLKDEDRLLLSAFKNLLAEVPPG